MKLSSKTFQTVSVISPNEAAPQRRGEILGVLYGRRRLMALVTAICLLVGGAYVLLAKPVYEANISIQVEDGDRATGSFLGDAANAALSVKTPASGETEILKSRMILAQAIDNTRLFINVQPLYGPLIGAWMTHGAAALLTPEAWGIDAYVSGKESIAVSQFDVPAAMEGTRFTLTADTGGTYTVSHKQLPVSLRGTVGIPLDAAVPGGQLHLLVARMADQPGALFELRRQSRQLTLLDLQDSLKVIEKGKQSGVIDVSWQDGDRLRLTEILNEIGRLYVRQNVDRKTAEAERTLGFLNTELPKFKAQLEQSEDYYNQYRNVNGTVSLDDEARNALSQTVDLQSKLLDARQKRVDLASRFTDQHPIIVTLDSQIVSLLGALGALDAQIRRMPMLQQSSLRMQRDIKVNTDLYATLLNSSLQMRLAKEGKVGNVRLIDDAAVPEEQVRPKRLLVMAFALLAGLFLGVMAALARHRMQGVVGNAAEIEARTGLTVLSTLTTSPRHKGAPKAVHLQQPGDQVLAISHPLDPAVESLRQLRATIKFAMTDAPNNHIMLTSARVGAGKSFVAANLATVLAASGKQVMLIDADLQGGHVADYFSLTDGPGLSEILVGSRTFEHVVQAQVLPNLDMLTRGTAPATGSELLGSDAFSHLLSKLSDRYDLVLINAPPLLTSSAAAAIAPYTATLLLVAQTDRTSLDDINECSRRLAHVGCGFDGVILNGAKAGRQRAPTPARNGRQAPPLQLPPAPKELNV